MLRRLADKVVIVTGAAAGIGEGCAIVAARDGAKVVVADIDEEKGKEVAQRIGGTFFHTDVKDTKNIDELVLWTATEFGRIDGVVNNAGTHNGLGLLTCEENDFSDLIDLNLTSMFRLSKSAVPHMKNSGGGSIVNMSSGVGLVGQDNSVAYAGAATDPKTLPVSLSFLFPQTHACILLPHDSLSQLQRQAPWV
jgi:NAD(P)-dependent dehydrogenase (short-subunit alcohol dehydrogenase family)